MCLFASLVLLLLYWQWRPIPEPVWTVQNPIAVAAVTAIFWLGWGMLLVSTFLISHFELFGLSQVFARLLGRELPAPQFHRRCCTGMSGTRSIWVSCSPSGPRRR